LKLSSATIYSLFAHEALHVWQRQYGEWVTLKGFFLQIGRVFGIDPYEYDRSIYKPHELLSVFKAGNIERQAQIFEDFVYRYQRGLDTSKFFGVWRHTYWRNNSN
jgi:hypothetical protein